MSVLSEVAHRSGRVDTSTVVAPGSTSSMARGPLRLRLSTSIGHGALDGAWWPYSRDLATEGIDLADHSPAALGRIWRIVSSAPDWGRRPRRMKAAKAFLSFGSFPDDDTHLVMLVTMSPTHSSRIIRLLVVPPGWDDRTARHAMRIAATPSNVKSATTILQESEDRLRAGLLAHWDDDGGPSSDA